MLKWIEFKSDDEFVKHNFSPCCLQIHIDDDSSVVIFNAPKRAPFRREEAIEVCKAILKQLEEE